MSGTGCGAPAASRATEPCPPLDRGLWGSRLPNEDSVYRGSISSAGVCPTVPISCCWDRGVCTRPLAHTQWPWWCEKASGGRATGGPEAGPGKTDTGRQRSQRLGGARYGPYTPSGREGVAQDGQPDTSDGRQYRCCTKAYV
ncbi:hypothetical protein NDU88_009596 [Pleurodeles waltl]|uniref:Uncharacterized protein n=1 Tax=Pleurodeles waltl TaxID=8319 RepID=A0AAV7RX11_PLEWA|nr:hypothetical protein NDU88_009596 [Pleurodeles waltl]